MLGQAPLQVRGDAGVQAFVRAFQHIDHPVQRDLFSSVHRNDSPIPHLKCRAVLRPALSLVIYPRCPGRRVTREAGRQDDLHGRWGSGHGVSLGMEAACDLSGVYITPDTPDDPG